MPSNYLNLKKIQETEVQKEYFPFFTVSNSFLEDVNSSALVEDFPDISEGGSFPVGVNAGQNIKDLIKEQYSALIPLLNTRVMRSLSSSGINAEY